MTSPEPDVPVTAARDTINARIRDLMTRPEDQARAEEYARLLVLWNAAPPAAAPHPGSEAEDGAPCQSAQATATCMDASHSTAPFDVVA
ncbi:hypothetical protein [Streptomyces sp. NPDC053560]|uniref:hypothetical protein n=1 Tax=Streptomyces sp. NPDC053560 TaxID=3365711 RepID=UPI0037D568D1